MAFGEVGTSLSKIKANSLNLAGTFGFTGTVSGLADETPLVLITETTASSDSTISFTSGIDSTYKEYMVLYNNIHPSSTSTPKFTFQFNASGGSGFNETITSTFFYAYHDEANSEAGVSYYGSGDQAQGTSFQRLSSGSVGAENDECVSGFLKLYNPSSTTFVKHFIAHNVTYQDNNSVNDNYVAGYINTTSAIDEIQFKFDDGNIDSGTFQLFGVV